MSEMDAGRITGKIPYPCGCPRSYVLVLEKGRTKMTARCPDCGRFACFDFDRMEAQLISPIRGAGKMNV